MLGQSGYLAVAQLHDQPFSVGFLGYIEGKKVAVNPVYFGPKNFGVR